MNSQTAFAYIKIGMIPCLLGILYFVLPGKPPTPDGIATQQKSEPHGLPNSEPSQKSEGNESDAKAQWPAFQLSDLESVDPFDRRMIFPELSRTAASDPNAVDRQSLVAINSLPAASKSEPIKVQAVFQSPQGIAALVGDRVIHVGDQLADGTHVIGITPEQLVVAMPSIN